MPPRYAYWTILIDNQPTAFRARERDELLPTLHQLRRKNADVVMKWFARGRLWESPEAERAAQRAAKPPREKRGRDWRPGGQHRDPRDRFKKGAKPKTGRRDRSKAAKPFGPPRERDRGPTDHRPHTRGPQADRSQAQRNATGPQKPWQDRGGARNRKLFAPRGKGGSGPWKSPHTPNERREAEPPPKRDQESPDRPPAPEQIVIKPEPPERGRPSDE